MTLDLRSLRHLLALAEHGNFGRAAESVHLTQSALSRSIQSLEASIGTRLFERTRGAIEPTEMGRLLLRRARALDAQARDIEREISLAKGLELGELRVAAGPWGGAALAGPVIGRLNAQHPRLRVKLLIAPWKELPERARARDVDLVVGELREIEQLEDFELCGLSLHRTVVAGRSGHPILRLAAPTPRDMFRFPLAGPRLPADAERALRAMAGDERNAGAPADVLTIECDSADVLRQVLMASDALSCMPTFLLREDVGRGLLATVPALELGLTARFGAAWLRGRALGGAGTRFVELLREHDRALAAV